MDDGDHDDDDTAAVPRGEFFCPFCRSCCLAAQNAATLLRVGVVVPVAAALGDEQGRDLRVGLALFLAARLDVSVVPDAFWL